jgi:acyl-CoA thioesterase-1
MISRYVWAGVLVAVVAGGCKRKAPEPAADAAAAPAGERRGRIVFLGTSLTAGQGLDPDQAYPALIQQKLDSAGLPYQAVNAGVSGETSAGARRRIDWLLREPAAVLVIETGANDGLRGQDVDSLRANIEAIIRRARDQRPPPGIILVGMRTVSNYGASYARRFQAAYQDLAEQYDLPFVPFLLQGVAGVDSLNQADLIHPTAEGQRRMAEIVWPVIKAQVEN